MIPHDTTAEAFDVQTEAYRRMSPEARVAILARMSEEMREVALAGIRGRHPEYSEEEARQALYRLLLGDTLVRAVWADRRLVDP